MLEIATCILSGAEINGSPTASTLGAYEDGLALYLCFDPVSGLEQEEAVAFGPLCAGTAEALANFAYELANAVVGGPCVTRSYEGGVSLATMWQYDGNRARIFPAGEGTIAVMIGTCQRGHVGVFDTGSLDGLGALVRAAASRCGVQL